jgi:3'-5' exoribonuclease
VLEEQKERRRLEGKIPLQVKELKNLNPGQQVFGKYLLLEKLHRKTNAGKDMYNIKLGDAGGDIDAVVWENCPIAGDLEVGAVIGLLGDMSSFNGKLQVTAKRIKVLEDDPAPFLKGPILNRETLMARFEAHIQSLQDYHLRTLLSRIFTPAVTDRFGKAAAAKSIHHNYSGGLLEHTLEVAELCLQAGRVWPGLNRDLLLAGTLLHDLGKIEELELKVIPRYTTEGRLLGHILIGTELVGAEINRWRQEGQDFPEELEWMLKHMILSHHGALEFGSPVIPLFPEALLLHFMDNLDAKMHIFFNKINESGGENEYFTNYDSFFAQHFFRYRYNSSAEEAE